MKLSVFVEGDFVWVEIAQEKTDTLSVTNAIALDPKEALRMAEHLVALAGLVAESTKTSFASGSRMSRKTSQSIPHLKLVRGLQNDRPNDAPSKVAPTPRRALGKKRKALAIVPDTSPNAYSAETQAVVDRLAGALLAKPLDPNARAQKPAANTAAPRTRASHALRDKALRKSRDSHPASQAPLPLRKPARAPKQGRAVELRKK